MAWLPCEDAMVYSHHQYLVLVESWVESHIRLWRAFLVAALLDRPCEIATTGAPPGTSAAQMRTRTQQSMFAHAIICRRPIEWLEETSCATIYHWSEKDKLICRFNIWHWREINVAKVAEKVWHFSSLPFSRAKRLALRMIH